MSDNVIEAQNLTKPMAKTTVVKGISFSVGRADIFGLLGPNGSDKRT
jgi:ABC-type (unclassified) transport system, ATPase component